MSYQHGAYGEIGNDKVKSAVQVDAVVAYIGTAPINLVLGYKEKGLINTPIKLENMPKTQATVGYSSNFTLCEPFDCHFANTIGNVGPIYIINVLDPAVHQKDVKTTVELTFKNGRAEYVTDTIILDTFALSDKVLGADYSLDYNYTKGAVVIESLNDADPITGTVEASFTEVDPSLVRATLSEALQPPARGPDCRLSLNSTPCSTPCSTFWPHRSGVKIQTFTRP